MYRLFLKQQLSAIFANKSLLFSFLQQLRNTLIFFLHITHPCVHQLQHLTLSQKLRNILKKKRHYKEVRLLFKGILFSISRFSLQGVLEHFWVIDILVRMEGTFDCLLDLEYLLQVVRLVLVLLRMVLLVGYSNCGKKKQQQTWTSEITLNTSFLFVQLIRFLPVFLLGTMSWLPSSMKVKSVQ